MKVYMRKRRSRIVPVAIIAMMMAVVFAVLAGVFGGEYDEEGNRIDARVTEYFNVDIDVHENNSYDFTERVGTVFNTPGHGIFRYIPKTWDGIDEDVAGGWCSSDDLDAYTESGSYVLQMGSEDRVISGKHEFTYGYNITMRDDRDTSRDTLYVDLIPTNWQTPIEAAEITVRLPKAIDKDSIKVYSGDTGTETLSEKVSWKYDGKKKITVKAKDLNLHEGITLFAELPEGYWVGQYNSDGSRTGAVAMGIVIALAFAALWILYGRRQQVVETVEFHPPEGVTPAEIGLMIDGTLDKKDMVSMFMYFAQKGYLKISEKKKKAFRFTKLKDIDRTREKSFAQVLFDGIFYGGKTEADSKDMGTEFGEHYMSACSTLEDSFGDVMPAASRRIQRLEGLCLYIVPIILFFMAEAYALRFNSLGVLALIMLLISAFFAGKLRKSYKNRNSGRKSGRRLVRCVYWIIDAMLLLFAGVGLGDCFESDAVGIVIAFCLAVCHVFNVYFDRMSRKVCENIGKVLGLRDFIKTAELDRLKALVEDNPSYYFDILPYAYVLGLTNVWAKKFESIDIKLPEWFDADPTGSYIPALYMGSAMNHMAGNVTSSVTKLVRESIMESSDTGGGFTGGSSGGGFSGGGSGGGGGGFW